MASQSKSLIFAAIGVVVGVALLFVFFQGLGKSADLEVKTEDARSKLNVATNNLVNACLNTLPNGAPECDDLRAQVADGCTTAQGNLDACKDGRVEQYYKGLSSHTAPSGASPAVQPAQTEPVSQPTTYNFDYQTMIVKQMGTTDFQILKTSQSVDGKVVSDVKVGNTIYNGIVSPLPQIDLNSTRLILTTQNYGPIYENFKDIHNRALACYQLSYPDNDWMHYTGWKPAQGDDACHHIGFHTAVFCSGRDAVPADYLYAYSQMYNKDWICNDSVIKVLYESNAPVESTTPKVEEKNTGGIGGTLSKFDGQWELIIDLPDINYGPDGILKVKITDYNTKDVILEKEYQLKLEEAVAYSPGGGGSHGWILPLDISQSDSKNGQVVLQLNYTTEQYNKNLTYSIGCDLSLTYQNVCS